MPRYFFNVYSDESDYEDEVGDELSDRIAAWQEATKTAGECLRDLDGKLEPGTSWRLEVTDEFRNTLFCIIVHSHSEV
jgi:hypothetical protein